MKVFVTGGAGYIGSVCVELLVEAGHQVTVYDNLSEGHRQAVDPRARLVLGDLSDPIKLLTPLRESRAEAIIHFAANALVGESMKLPAKYFRNNVTGGLNLLDAAVATRIRKIVFSSTCATYGTPESLPITETTPQKPINPYGESKLMFERMLHWFQEIHGLDFVTFRYFNAAGASARYGECHRIETHLIPNALQVALGHKKHCPIFGDDYPTLDGTCIRDYIHVVDIARAHLLALEGNATGFFNLGNGEGYSVKEVISACERITKIPIPIQIHPRRLGDPPRLVAQADKARQILGWTPKFPKIEEIVASAWAWHSKYPLGYVQ